MICLFTQSYYYNENCIRKNIHPKIWWEILSMSEKTIIAFTLLCFEKQCHSNKSWTTIHNSYNVIRNEIKNYKLSYRLVFQLWNLYCNIAKFIHDLISLDMCNFMDLQQAFIVHKEIIIYNPLLNILQQNTIFRFSFFMSDSYLQWQRKNDHYRKRKIRSKKLCRCLFGNWLQGFWGEETTDRNWYCGSLHWLSILLDYNNSFRFQNLSYRLVILLFEYILYILIFAMCLWPLWTKMAVYKWFSFTLLFPK